MKRLMLLLLALSTAGCAGNCSRAVANVTGWSRVCVDGVTYLQFPSGVTPQYTTEGKLVPCR